MKMLIEFMRRPESIFLAGDITPEVTKTEHVNGWRHMKERTASLEMDLAFCDHKTAIQDEEQIFRFMARI